MKALLIKTDAGTIEEVDFNGTLEHAYELLGVSIIERVELNTGDDVWIDEEGLFSGVIDKYGQFTVDNGTYFPDEPKLLAGRGLITGNVEGEEGEEWGNVKMSLEDAKRHVVIYPAA